MNTIYRSNSTTAIHQRRVFLESAGIACSILHEGVNSAYGEVPIVEMELVLLDPTQLDEALQKLADFDRTKTAGARWHCPTCGEELEPQFSDCWKCQSES